MSTRFVLINQTVKSCLNCSVLCLYPTLWQRSHSNPPPPVLSLHKTPWSAPKELNYRQTKSSAEHLVCCLTQSEWGSSWAGWLFIVKCRGTSQSGSTPTVTIESHSLWVQPYTPDTHVNLLSAHCFLYSPPRFSLWSLILFSAAPYGCAYWLVKSH